MKVTLTVEDRYAEAVQQLISRTLFLVSVTGVPVPVQSAEITRKARPQTPEGALSTPAQWRALTYLSQWMHVHGTPLHAQSTAIPAGTMAALMDRRWIEIVRFNDSSSELHLGHRLTPEGHTVLDADTRYYQSHQGLDDQR